MRVFVFIFTAALCLHASPGTEDILKSNGARAVGMGGAFSAVADDYSAFFWNPAGLVQQRRTSLSGYYDNIYKGSQAGFGFAFMNPVYISTQSKAVSYNMTFGAALQKNFYSAANFDDTAFYLSYATYIDDEKNLSAGLNVKFLNSAAKDLELYGTASSVDMGLLYSTRLLDRKMRLAFIVQDFDATMQWSNKIREKLPAVYKLGSCYLIDDSFIIALDLDYIDYGNQVEPARSAIHFGAEKYYYNEIAGNFGFRAGYYWKEMKTTPFRFTFGFTYGREDFAINYLYTPDFNNLGETHKLDFTYYLGSGSTMEKKEETKKEGVRTGPSEEEKAIIKNESVYRERFREAEFTVSQRYFSPDGDGKLDTVDFYFKGFPEDVQRIKWAVEISDRLGKVVKTFTGRDAPPDSIQWDGRDGRGAKSRDSDYGATFRIYYEEKEIWQKTKVIAVDTTPPVFNSNIYPKLFAPHPQSSVKNLQITLRTKARDIESWTLFIRDAKGNIVRRLSGQGLTDKLIWDGQDALGNVVMDGDYAVDIEVNDFAGNVYRQKENFTVDTAVASFGVKAENRIFEPGAQQVTFVFTTRDAAKIKSWDLIITDDTGKIVKSFRDKSIGVRSVSWDGTDAANAYVRAGSVYKYKLTVTQKNDLVTSRESYVETKLPVFKDLGMSLMLAAVDFPQASSEIPVEKYGYLNQAAEAVQKYAKDYYLFIKGYAVDNADAEENLKLSLDRAQAVRDYLVKNQAVPPANVFIIGYGDGQFDETLNAEDIQKNARRVEVELITK